MGGRGRVDNQGFGVSHVGQVAQELRVLDEFDPGFHTAFHPETQDRPRAFGQVLPGEFMVFIVFEAGVFHPGDRVMPGKILRHLQGIFAMAVHAHRQGFQPLQEQEGIERAQAGTQRAQDFTARLHGVTEIAERFIEAHAVIALGRFGHAGEFTVGPVEPARFDQYAANRCAMTADELGRGMSHDICPEVQRPA